MSRFIENDRMYSLKAKNLSADYARREVEEQDIFFREIRDELSEESDVTITERIMSECVCRSDSAVVPHVKKQYLYKSAEIAAIYILEHSEEWQSGVLPDFYENALNQAYTSLTFYDDMYCFADLLVYNMLRLYKLKDVQGIIDCMNEVSRFIHQAKKSKTYFVSKYRQQSWLYYCYERVCYLTCAFLDFDKAISVTESIRLLRRLTKLKNREYLMRVYKSLYQLYLHNWFHPESTSIPNINPSTGYTYLEEYLEKAYTMMGYKLENLNMESYSHRTWLRIALSYARHMCSETNSLIPYNPTEAKRIMQYAAQVDIEDISYFAKKDLQEYFKE